MDKRVAGHLRRCQEGMTHVHHQGVLESVMSCLLQLLRAQNQFPSTSSTNWQHKRRAYNGVTGDTQQTDNFLLTVRLFVGLVLHVPSG